MARHTSHILFAVYFGALTPLLARGVQQCAQMSAEEVCGELETLKSQLGEKERIIESLTEALQELRSLARGAQSTQADGRTQNHCQKSSFHESGMRQEKLLSFHRHQVHESGAFEVEAQNEWTFGVPSGAPGSRKIVIELGANNGEWIAQFLDEHEGFWPVVIEPQPVFAEALRGLAREYGGMFIEAAAWKTSGEWMHFHAHTDVRGGGSSLFEDSVYASGHCWGQLECPYELREKYSVLTIDVAALIQRVATPDDYIVLRMDIEGAEYEVSRRLLVSGVACWLDEWEVEVHAMYAAQNHKYRPVDAVLPWLVRACGVNNTVFQHYHVDDKLRALTQHVSDPCARALYAVDAGCSSQGVCHGIPD